MPNSFDSDFRGPSNRRLFVAGVCFCAIVAGVIQLCLMKSKGRLDDIVRVSAELVNVGDGLPAKSDVKFRGLLVGEVAEVQLHGNGQPNTVRINLKPRYASRIPDTVTARVVPSNVFAVSSVQLVSNGPRVLPLRSGSVIHEDTSLPTVLFQSLLTKIRQLLKSVSREPADNTVGVLAALSGATESRGSMLRAAGADLKDIVSQLNTVVGGNDEPSSLSALAAATQALRQAEPGLSDALQNAVAPMRALAETRSELTGLLSAGVRTTGTLGDAFDNQTDRLIAITTQLTPVVGVLADNADKFAPIATRMSRMAERVEDTYDTDRHNYVIKVIVTLAPYRQYVRADCPRYGKLEGPSCQTAPEVPTAPDLFPALASMGIPPPPGANENRPNRAPPRDSVRHAGEVPGGVGATASPAPIPPPSPDTADHAEAQPQPAKFGGTVGPVGGPTEGAQLSQIVGHQASSSDRLLLGPVVRGTAVHIAPDLER
ncbi:MCE family protein [Mycobacterium sp. CBMA271]|uniref:MlaD family protein n=1 Tax=unclassified Mycobacteroides TaxID=2618759 RepID=UPI0012DD3B23|nr:MULTISPECIES: MCE family protein [unclassified Mycobacteroides]MUM19448.1 mammalian cell entry protein [Mycobacteroides sp. CBMA 326]MUM21419.1 MCE family protein [Mycobacteroides sp. CBMA 271]